MKISDIHNKKKNVLSFEIFPPKKDDELRNIEFIKKPIVNMIENKQVSMDIIDIIK